MAKYRITSPDGASFDITAPDGASPEQVQQFAQQQFATMQQQPGPAGNAAAGGNVGGIKQGLRDPIDAGAQMLRRLVPEPIAKAVDAAGNWMAEQGLPVARSSGVQGVDQIVRNVGQQYEADRAAAGRSGFDGARLTGNLVNPVNLALPSAAAARTVGQFAKFGAVAGGIGGAMQPITENTDNFWWQKGGQAALGAATGAVLTPAITKGVQRAGTAIAERMANQPAQTMVAGGQNLTRADLDVAVNRLLESQGMTMQEAPKVILDSVRRQIGEAVAGRAKLDPAQALRQAQAEALGLTGDAALTAGQLSRDPMRFAQERNLAGIVIDTPAGPGNPLSTRFARQNQALGRVFNAADGAADRVTAGEQMLGSLQQANERADKSVGSAYRAFRESTGRDLEVPLQGLAQDYAATLNTFGDAIPSAVRRQFESLGLMTGKQSRALSIQDAENIIKAINANTDPANKPAFRALGELRGAVEKAITGAADNAPTGAGAEAAQLAKEARSTAAGVFQTRRDVPALKAALDDVAPDRFVQRFILSAPTREADGMAQVLSQDPAAMGQARAQVLRYLQKAAFGENLSGDKVFAADRYAKALDAIGPQKLRVFFSPDEAVRLNLVGRVASDINSEPVGAVNAVNRSGTAAAGFNLLQMLANSPVARNIPGARALSDQAKTIANERAINGALQPAGAAAKPPAELSPNAVRAIQRLFTPAALGFGAAAGGGN